MLRMWAIVERGVAPSQAPLSGRGGHARQSGLALPRAPLQVPCGHALRGGENAPPSYIAGRLTLRCEMEKRVYDRRQWRSLPREFCAVEQLFGEAVGPCHGLIHLHHVDENDPDSRSVPVCQRHHPSLQAALRRLRSPETVWKRCRHHHSTAEGRAACERRLNQHLTAA